MVGWNRTCLISENYIHYMFAFKFNHVGFILYCKPGFFFISLSKHSASSVRALEALVWSPVLLVNTITKHC